MFRRAELRGLFLTLSVNHPVRGEELFALLSHFTFKISSWITIKQACVFLLDFKRCCAKQILTTLSTVLTRVPLPLLPSCAHLVHPLKSPQALSSLNPVPLMTTPSHSTTRTPVVESSLRTRPSTIQYQPNSITGGHHPLTLTPNQPRTTQ